MDWKAEVTMDMLPAAHRKLAEVIGVQATLQLCETFGGETMYIPLTDAVYATVRRRWIRAEYLQKNASPRSIARKYGLSEREVQRIVSEVRPAQIGLADVLDGG